MNIFISFKWISNKTQMIKKNYLEKEYMDLRDKKILQSFRQCLQIFKD